MNNTKSTNATNASSEDINKLRFTYFCLFGTMGILSPFLPLFFQSVGYSKLEIGILGGLPPLSSFIFGPLWSFLADYISKHEFIILMNHTISTTATSLMYFISSFNLMIGFVLFISITKSPVSTLLDSFTLSSLSDKTAYGSIRYMGAASFGIFSFIGAYLTGDEGLEFKSVFITFTIVSIVTLYAFKQLNISKKKLLQVQQKQKELEEEEQQQQQQQQQDEKEVNQDLMARLFQTLSQPHVFIFFCIVTISGIAFGIIENFLFIRLKELGGPGLLLGCARFIMCFSEIPFFIYSGRIQNYLGTWQTLCFTQLMFIIRNIVYIQLINPWYVLPAEVLHGITFASMWSTSCTFAQAISPPGLESTIQAILSSLHFGVGSATGMILGGYIYQNHGAKPLFAMNAFGCSISAFLTCIAMFSKFTDPVVNKNENGDKNDIKYVQLPTRTNEDENDV